MRIRSIALSVVLFAAVPLFAAGSKLYPAYEATRQALISASMPGIQKSAKNVGSAARAERQQAVAARADALAKAADLESAKAAFAALSDEMIRFRAADRGERPIVAYCSMEKKSWLQPAGEIGNPYVAPGMRRCGEVKAR